MKVAILGTGGIGLGCAAYLAKAGHAVSVWSPSGRGIEPFASGAPLQAEGAVEGAFPIATARACKEALAGADALLVTLPGNGHRTVIDAMAPHLEPGQVAIISSHASFGALYLSKKLAERGVAVPIAAWATTPLMARRAAPDRVYVSAVRKRFDVATVPAGRADEGLAACRALFGDRFEPRADLIAISLSNVNPHAHMAMALGNLTRMEAGERWANYAGVTHAVGRLIEALDQERVRLAEAFGVKVRTMREHMRLTFGVPDGTIGEMAAAVHALGIGPPGPATLETRYVLEDAPFGLVPMIATGRLAGVPMPLHEAGLKLLSVIWERDFAAENDILPALEFDRLRLDDLRRLAREGWRAG